MAKKPAPRTPPEDQSFLDKLRSSLGNIPAKGDPSRRKFHFSFWYFLMAFFLISLIQNYYLARQVNTISYSIFKHYVNDGKVKDLVLRTDQITGVLTETAEGKKDQPFVTVRVEDPELVALLDQKNISYTGHIESKWLGTLLSWITSLVNEAPRSKLRGICGAKLRRSPTRLRSHELRRGRLAIPRCSKLQSILAKANEGNSSPGRAVTRLRRVKPAHTEICFSSSVRSLVEDAFDIRPASI